MKNEEKICDQNFSKRCVILSIIKQPGTSEIQIDVPPADMRQDDDNNNDEGALGLHGLDQLLLEGFN